MLLDVDEYDPQPADLLGCSSHWREPTGWLIKLATRSVFSHVAGVALVADHHLHAEVRRRREATPDPDRPGCVWAQRILDRACPAAKGTLHALDRLRREGWQSRPLLFEATTLAESPCSLQGAPVCGVQAHDPRERIRQYDGRVWLYRPTLDYRIDPEQSERLTLFLLRHLGDQYDYAQAGLSASILARRAWWFSQGNLHSLFCSELWAAALEQIRLLELANPSKFSPARLVRSLLELGSYRLVGEIVKGHNP